MAEITLKDVAQKCGLSATTVSRVLSESDYPVSEQAKQKIRQTASELGYVVNSFARSLKTSVSNEVAVVVPSVENLFYGALLAGTEERLFFHKMNMLVYITGRHGWNISALIKDIRAKRPAGLIVDADSFYHVPVKEMELLFKSGVRILAVNCPFESGKNCTGVYFDYAEGAQLAAEHLLACGHRRIAYATNQLDRPSRLARKDGYQKAFEKAGLSLQPQDMFESEQTTPFAAGRDLAQKILSAQAQYTAIAASNDMIAMGLIATLTAAGLRIPQDVSVIGYDGISVSEVAVPSLTTVYVPAHSIGKMAADLLVKQLQGESYPADTFLKPKLIQRDSVKNLG